MRSRVTGNMAVCVTAVIMTTKDRVTVARGLSCDERWSNSLHRVTISYRSRISLGVQLRDMQIIMASFSACSSSLRTESR